MVHNPGGDRWFRGALGGSSQDLDMWLITMVIVVVPDSWASGTPYKWPFYGL